MLRNRSERIAAGPGAGRLVAGTRFVGLTGAEILAATSTGSHGDGIFVPWDVDPARRYRAVVTALTGGPLILDEAGAGEASAAFSATLSVYEDNLLVASDIALDGGIAFDATVAASITGVVGSTVAAAVDVTTPTAEVAAIGVVGSTFAAAVDITTPPATVTFDDSGTVNGVVAALADIVTPPVVVVIDASGQIVGTFAATSDVLQSIIASVNASGQIVGSMSAAAEAAAVTVSTSVGGTARLIRWADKDPRESFTISFAFPGVPTDVVINVDVYSQYGLTDPNPESIFNGSFQVNGNVVSQAVARDQGVDLVDYYIDCVATVNGERLVAAGCLPVRTK